VLHFKVVGESLFCIDGLLRYIRAQSSRGHFSDIELTALEFEVLRGSFCANATQLLEDQGQAG
jgi:hypothetical protein